MNRGDKNEKIQNYKKCINSCSNLSYNYVCMLVTFKSNRVI